MPSTIVNAANTPLNEQTGTVPDVSGALMDWFQPMTFALVTKANEAFQAVESSTEIVFRGVIQPLADRRLSMKPEGQQAWTWKMVHSDICLGLGVDDCIIYLGVQYRVMAVKDYLIYGFFYYELVQDYTGSGPTAG